MIARMTQLRRWGTGLIGAALLSGCVVEFTPDPDDGGSGGETKITIRVVNASSVIVDPEIFLSATPVAADQLFVDGNKFTQFGFATLGLIDGGETDSFEVDCSVARVIGTKGGRFGDDLNNPIGSGQQIVLTQELSVFCGGTLTLTFAGGGSTFTTNYSVAR